MSEEQEQRKEWKEVSPGLWECENTPKAQNISGEIACIYREAASAIDSPLAEQIVELVLEVEQ